MSSSEWEMQNKVTYETIKFNVANFVKISSILPVGITQYRGHRRLETQNHSCLLLGPTLPIRAYSERLVNSIQCPCPFICFSIQIPNIFSVSRDRK